MRPRWAAPPHRAGSQPGVADGFLLRLGSAVKCRHTWWNQPAAIQGGETTVRRSGGFPAGQSYFYTFLSLLWSWIIHFAWTLIRVNVFPVKCWVLWGDFFNSFIIYCSDVMSSSVPSYCTDSWILIVSFLTVCGGSDFSVPLLSHQSGTIILLNFVTNMYLNTSKVWKLDLR